MAERAVRLSFHERSSSRRQRRTNGGRLARERDSAASHRSYFGAAIEGVAAARGIFLRRRSRPRRGVGERGTRLVVRRGDARRALPAIARETGAAGVAWSASYDADGMASDRAAAVRARRGRIRGASSSTTHPLSRPRRATQSARPRAPGIEPSRRISTRGAACRSRRTSSRCCCASKTPSFAATRCRRPPSSAAPPPRRTRDRPTRVASSSGSFATAPPSTRLPLRCRRTTARRILRRTSRSEPSPRGTVVRARSRAAERPVRAQRRAAVVAVVFARAGAPRLLPAARVVPSAHRRGAAAGEDARVFVGQRSHPALECVAIGEDRLSARRRRDSAAARDGMDASARARRRCVVAVLRSGGRLARRAATNGIAGSSRTMPALATGNWQWIAGVGADMAQYPRIYNPERQRRRYDPAGAYVRRGFQSSRTCRSTCGTAARSRSPQLASRPLSPVPSIRGRRSITPSRRARFYAATARLRPLEDSALRSSC